MEENVSGYVVDINSASIFPGTVYFSDGKITKITHAAGDSSTDDVFPRASSYIMPGFVDAHIHLEMTQLSPCEYAAKALSQGVIGAVADCHDCTAVLGRAGICAIIENSHSAPFYFGFSAPSTLHEPTYSFEDVDALLQMKEITHLGQIFDFPGVVLHDAALERLFKLAEKYHKPVDGYAPGLKRLNLIEYCKSPISTDHQCYSYDDAVEKIEQGLLILIPTRDRFDPFVMEPLFDDYADRLMLCSDVVFCANIGRHYLNQVAAHAIRNGHNIFNVLKAASTNPVKHYKLSCGQLQVGDNADFIVVDTPENCTVQRTYIAGKCVFDIHKNMSESFSNLALPVMNHFSAPVINQDDIRVSLERKDENGQVTIIDICDGEINTVRKTVGVWKHDRYLESDCSTDCLKVVLYNRYGMKKPVVAFVHGFGFKSGAFAMSICHEEHHVIAVGVSDEDIVCAVNHVISLRGGIAIAVNNTIRADVSLPFAGLVSCDEAEETSLKFDALYPVLHGEMGCSITRPVRTLSYLGDVDIPSIKLSSEGLFNVVEQELIPLIC